MTRRVHVGFVGLMKVGKSTTLNALLHSRVLPSSIKPETAVEVTIVHNTSHPDGALVGLMKVSNTRKVIARGNENITKMLQQLNKQKRDRSKDEEWSKYENISLHIPVPFLTNTNMHISLTISDTPGSDEAVLDSLNLNKSIEHLAAFVVVLDYRRMKTTQEISLLKALRGHHSRVFDSPHRLLFILNHINSYDEHQRADKDHSIPPEQAPQFVANYLREHLKVEISSRQVIPYSAYWALVSRLGLSHPHHMTDDLIREAQLVLHNEGDKLNSTNLCRTLEKYSNIKAIEDRMVQLFVDFGRKVIEKKVADKTMLNITALINIIDEQIVMLQVPEKEKNVSTQSYILKAMPLIVLDAERVLSTTSLQSLTNISHVWRQMAMKLDDLFTEVDGAVYTSKETMFSSIQSALLAIERNIMRYLQVLLNDLLNDYKNNTIEALQLQQSLIQIKFNEIFGETIAKSDSPLSSSVLPNFTIPQFGCKSSFVNYINIFSYAKVNTSTITSKVLTKYSFLHPTHHLICEHDMEENREELCTIRVLQLQREMMKYLEPCYKLIESKVEQLTTNYPVDIGRKLSDHIKSWWEKRKDDHEDLLARAQSTLKTAVSQSEDLNTKKSQLKQYFQSLECVL